jgi:predicted amidophosphoribosyltransferase
LPIRPLITARAAVRFDEVSRALVHALKYGDRLDLAPMMGRWISQAGREVLASADALVLMPLHWRRLWARRFNQSAMLASAISRKPACRPPARSSGSSRPAQQVGLSRTERAANVQGGLSRARRRQGGRDGRR